MKKLIAIVVLLIAIGATGAVFYAKRADKEPTITTLKTSRGSIVDAVGATGTLQAVTTVTVGTQVSGIVQSLEGIDFNSIVKKGQVIARLDPSILETQVETAKANLTNANANLERQKVAVADAESKLRRAKELADRQLINKVDLENAETTLKSANAQLRSTESSIVQAEASVNKARVDLDHTVITAPIDGIIIKRSVDRGQTVNAGMSAPELFIIAADLTKMQVNASIDETDVGRMRPGQAVTFRVDAYPTETFLGTVKQVRLNPVTVQNVVTYSTVIDVPNIDLKLKPGMTANVNVEIARRDNVLRIPNAAIRFRPTKDIFDALNQAMPPELERGGRGGTRGGANAQGGPSTGPGQAAPQGQPGAPVAAPAANQPGAPSTGSGQAAPQPPGTGTAGQVEAKAQAAPRPGNPSAGSGQGGGGRNRQQGQQAAGGNAGGGENPQGGGRNAGGGQGGRGGFGNMTPEEREKRRQEREAMLAKMTPEERAAYDQKMRERMAQGGGRGGPGGGGGNFGGRGGPGGGGNFGGRGGQGGQGGGNAGNPQRNASAGSGQNPGRPTGSIRGQLQGQVASNANSAATTSATTIDALFAPLPVIETRGRAWLFINKQLKPVSLRLGISDGTFTEVLNDTELQADIDVVTAVITPEMASRPANQQNNNAGNPLMPAQRGRGPGGPGGGGGGGGRGGGR